MDSLPTFYDSVWNNYIARSIHTKTGIFASSRDPSGGGYLTNLGLYCKNKYEFKYS